MEEIGERRQLDSSPTSEDAREDKIDASSELSAQSQRLTNETSEPSSISTSEELLQASSNENNSNEDSDPKLQILQGFEEIISLENDGQDTIGNDELKKSGTLVFNINDSDIIIYQLDIRKSAMEWR